MSVRYLPMAIRIIILALTVLLVGLQTERAGDDEDHEFRLYDRGQAD